MDDIRDVQSALDAIDCAGCTREEWITVGMALKEGGIGVEVWDAWSATDPARYRQGECQKKWDSFRGAGKPVTLGTLFHMAQERGWTRPHDDYALDWDSYIEYDGDLEPGSPELPPADQLILYLRTLFKPGEYVGYVTNDAHCVEQNGTAKWVPSSAGVYWRTMDEIIAQLDKYRDDMTYAIDSWHEEAGAWIRFNPLDGKGARNDNVVAFRYALVESDDMPINDQIAKYEQLQLPIAAMVYSGKKSVHAIVKIEAKDLSEYQQRVNYLYDFLEKHGVKVDRQNRNPSRLSRMPGITRNGVLQKLRGVNIGRKSWLDWMDYAEGVDDGLPAITDLYSQMQSPPAMPDELIQGVLRRGHKMLLSSTSKAGKSFLMMELCICIAEGLPWLGFSCKQGRVLYVNLEIDPASCINRFIEIYRAMGISEPNSGNVQVWNLRGKALRLDEMVPKLVRRARDMRLDAIVLDPLYKILTGDENNASDMAYFCNQFDRISEALGCAVIYCHHHSKGAQGAKRAMDRASGSGVFARDPDTILDMIELDMTDEVRDMVADRGAVPFRLEGNLREFRNFEPKNFWFTWPVHVLDTTGELAKLGAQGSAEAGSIRAAKARADDATDRYIDAFKQAAMGDPDAMLTARDIAAVLYDNPSENAVKAVRKYLSEGGSQWFEEVGEGSRKTKFFKLRQDAETG